LEPRVLLRRLLDTAIGSAQPAVCVPPHLPAKGGRLLVLGAGKASAAMARAVENHWQGELSGLVVTQHGYAVECRHIEILESSHPIPGVAGLRAAERMLAMAQHVSADDHVLCLISGGGSALLPLPGGAMSLQQKQDISRALLKSGASISEMNCVRRHLSAIKGGRLAAAFHPARVTTLLMSDVPGDRPVDIASGPTVGDPTTIADALKIVERYGIVLPAAAIEYWQGAGGESVKPDDPRLARATHRLIAAPQLALEAAAAEARKLGMAAHILGDAIEGEAREVAKVHAGIALQIAAHSQPFAAPTVLLSGGETTVTVRGQGRGGRNVEFLLSLAIALAGRARIHALAGDTDGIDGQEPIAGAYVGPDTLRRAWERGLNPRQMLENNDAHSFFASLDDSVITGPTFTNVNDFRAILIE
jgi:glycerate 2-kinase